MPSEGILPGSIIWATVEDESFSKRKDRPLVVLRVCPPDQVECVCVTTDVSVVPLERRVQIPHEMVGLTKICVANAGWIRFVDIEAIVEVMPNRLPRASFEAILRKAKR